MKALAFIVDPLTLLNIFHSPPNFGVREFPYAWVPVLNILTLSDAVKGDPDGAMLLYRSSLNTTDPADLPNLSIYCIASTTIVGLLFPFC